MKSFKIINAIIGAIITFIILMGVMFKMMHWPGAAPMIVLGTAFLSLYVYLVAIYNILSNKGKIILKICNGAGAFFGSILIVGFLFKIMHWPGGGVMTLAGMTFSSITLLLLLISFIISKEAIKISPGTFFSISAFGVLAFGVAVQGPSYNILTGIVESNKKTEIIISQSSMELDIHVATLNPEKSFRNAINDLHNHIENLKSKLIEIAEPYDYDAPTHLMGLVDPGHPIKVSGLEEFSVITLKEKIEDFNNQMEKLDSSFESIKTDKKHNSDGHLDSWETTTFYHMPAAQVILTLSLIDAEALTKCNYHIVKNYPKTINDEAKEEQ